MVKNRLHLRAADMFLNNLGMTTKGLISRAIRGLLALVFLTAMITDVDAAPMDAIDAPGLITWMLDGLTSFQSGETVNGNFTIDQSIANGPVVAPLARWQITVTEGFNPLIPNITFSDTDSGCVVGCARVFLGGGSVTTVDFRTPLAPDNTFYELALNIGAEPNEVIFPSTEELIVPTLPFPTDIQYNRLIDPNTVANITRSDLTSNGRITTQAVAEPSTLGSLIIGIASFGLAHRSWN
jgi:hypothetical protein